MREIYERETERERGTLFHGLSLSLLSWFSNSILRGSVTHIPCLALFTNPSWHSG